MGFASCTSDDLPGAETETVTVSSFTDEVDYSTLPLAVKNVMQQIMTGDTSSNLIYCISGQGSEIKGVIRILTVDSTEFYAFSTSDYFNNTVYRKISRLQTIGICPQPN